MVMVLLNWLYIAITSLGTGLAVLSFFSWIFNRNNEKLLPNILAGLVVNTVFAQAWSLFGEVGLWANVVLCVITVGSMVLCRKQLGDILGNTVNRLHNSKGLNYTYIIVILLMAYGTSRGYIHYDTSLYHAQSIRWIEEYGVVKGLACLQLRFGYNSSAFALTALYSFAFWLKQSLHTTAGFFALLGFMQVIDIYKVFLRKSVRHSDFIRLGLLFYLGLIFKEMVSPASDYYAQILIFSMLIMWLDALDDYEKDSFPFAMLSILMVYAATIKFSIALLVLIVIKPAVMMIKSRQFKQIISCLVAGIIVLLPFFIRNVLISGWLIYPSTFIDLFNPDWKIPKGVAQYDAMEIGVYGKGINDVTKLDMPISQWLPSWFNNMSLMEKGWIILTVLGVIAGIVYFGYKVIRKSVSWDRFHIFAVLVISASFWFVSAPLVRYGYGYLITIPFFVDGCLCFELIDKFGDKRALFIAYSLVFAVIGLYRVKTFLFDVLDSVEEPYYYAQEDYIDWPADEYMLDDRYKIYIPQTDALIGYNQFPASLLTIDVEMRGEGLDDGFRFKNYQEFIDNYMKQEE